MGAKVWVVSTMSVAEAVLVAFFLEAEVVCRVPIFRGSIF